MSEKQHVCERLRINNEKIRVGSFGWEIFSSYDFDPEEEIMIRGISYCPYCGMKLSRRI